MDTLKSGDLNTKAIVLERGNTSAKVGPSVSNWQEATEINGKLDNVKYIKAAIYANLRIEGDSEFTCRYKPWLTIDHRLKIGGQLHAITRVSADKKANSMLLLLKAVDK